jgi:phosphatidylglycerophosphate synthase
MHFASGRRLAGATAWRLAIATSAALGVLLAAAQYDVWWTALSQLASLAVLVGYLWLAAYPFVSDRGTEPPSPWLRGCLATQMVLVSLAFLAMSNGNLTDPYSLFEHVLTPALVVADFLLVGGNQAGVRWWHPLTWLLPPLAYLAYYVGADLRVYAALDAADPAAFVSRLAALAALVLAAGFGLYAVGRRARVEPMAGWPGDSRPPVPARSR